MHTWGNQRVPQLLLKLSDTLHIQYRYNELVHEEVPCQKKIFLAKWLLIKYSHQILPLYFPCQFSLLTITVRGYLVSIAYYTPCKLCLWVVILFSCCMYGEINLYQSFYWSHLILCIHNVATMNICMKKLDAIKILFDKMTVFWT